MWIKLLTSIFFTFYCRSEFAVHLAYFYLCDRTDFFGSSKKVNNFSMLIPFVFHFLLLSLKFNDRIVSSASACCGMLHFSLMPTIILVFHHNCMFCSTYVFLSFVQPHGFPMLGFQIVIKEKIAALVSVFIMILPKYWKFIYQLATV